MVVCVRRKEYFSSLYFVVVVFHFLFCSINLFVM